MGQTASIFCPASPSSPERSKRTALTAMPEQVEATLRENLGKVRFTKFRQSLKGTGLEGDLARTLDRPDIKAAIGKERSHSISTGDPSSDESYRNLLASKNLDEFRDETGNRINFRGKFVGVAGVAKIAHDIETITHLDLSFTGCGDEGAEILALALSSSASLNELVFQGNRISQGAIRIGEALEKNNSLSVLDVSDNLFCDKGASRLGEALRKNSSLTTLNLSRNKVGCEGAAAIGTALEKNEALTTLNISENEIGAWGTKAIADGLAKNGTLTNLDLSKNSLSDLDFLGVRSIFKALQTNSSLTNLNLEATKVGEKGASIIASELANNKSLAALSLKANSIGPSGAEEIGKSLAMNSSLATLDLSSNGTGNAGGVKIVGALVKNRSLADLDLEGNNVGKGTLARLGYILERNQIYKEHAQGVAEYGPSFYIQLSEKDESCSLEWKVDRIREAAIKDTYGTSLPFVYDILRTLLQEIILQDQIQDTTNASSSSELVLACSDSDALKHLVDNCGIDGRSNLLHVVVSTYHTDMLSFCKFLVDEVGAEFDTLTDSHGRTARNIALANRNEVIRGWALSVGTLFGRYKVEVGPPVNKSATATVKFATDVIKVEDKDEDDASPQVALKFVTNRAYFERELRMRLFNPDEIESGEKISHQSQRFDEDHAVKLLRFHDEQDTDGKHAMCMVMPRAERNLDHIIRAERVAGHDLYLIKYFARDIARALEHLHSDPHYIVHGDVKPRNIVRIRSDFKLIDFDASVKVGCSIGNYRRSTGYCPPELAKVLFIPNENLDELEKEREEWILELEGTKKEKARAFIEHEIEEIEQKIDQIRSVNPEYPEARPTHDIWSFGVVMYYMLTGRSLFKCDTEDNLDGDEQKRQLVQWQGLRPEHLKRVLEKCRGATSGDVHAAKDLIKHCLNANPDNRPQSMTDVLNMPFLRSSTDSKWTPAERNSFCVLFSDPLVRASDGNILPFLPRLNFEHERDLLKRCIRNSKKDIDLCFDAATCARLQELATARCGCLHFSGHGFGTMSGNDSSYLVFEDGSGGAEFISPSDLRALLGSHIEPFKFVFVSACHSEDVGRAFINAGVKHVVCCEQQSELNHEAAAEFTSSFYDALANAYTIKMAFFSAKGIVSARYDDDESNKFKLLPEDEDHEVTVFDADEVEAADDETVGRIPIPPVNFLGREKVMHDLVYCLLSERRLVTLVGKEGIGRSSLASAVCCYIKDRLNTTLNIDELVFVRRNRAGADSQGSLLMQLHEQLAVTNGVPTSDEVSLEDRICEILLGSKMLIVFDDVDDMERSFGNFLRVLFEKTRMVKVLLVARRRTGFLSSSVVEKAIRVRQLERSSAMELFVKTCPHADTRTKREELKHTLESRAMLSLGMTENGSESCRAVIDAIRGGIPSGIIKAATNLSDEEYGDLIGEIS